MRAWKQTLVAAAVLGGISAGAAPALGVQIYGWQTTLTSTTFSSSMVEWRNPPTLGTVDIGDTSGANLSFDPAFSPAGVLWGTDGGSVFTMDPELGTVGSPVTITSHVFSLNEFLVGVTFSPSGTMYSWSQNNGFTSGLYTINAAAGTAAIVSPDLGDSIFGMTFAPNGNLYASDGSSLLRLNPANGAVIQTIGTFPTFITSLGWGPDGVLRGLEPIGGADTPGTNMYTINPANAALTLIGTSNESIYGIAAIPGPGVLTPLGAALIAVRRRRR